MLEFSEGVTDLFAELQETLANGHIPFSTPLAPVDEEHELVDYSEPDFGIDIPDSDPPAERAARITLSPDTPTYPWASKADFITALLFSSPRLPFSDAQKKAVLNWAKELGARDVPSLYAIKKSQAFVEDTVGQPTEKVSARSGNIFYINNIANAIAKDYGNPLTRFAMHDYPEDGGNGMSQIFNGRKMLLDLPSPPAARVDGKVFFVDEILQECSGDYFVPERFFLGSSSVNDSIERGEKSDTKVLYALGRAIQRTDDGFIVNDEQEILPTSMFVRSYEDIASTGELDVGLTPSSAKYASLAPNALREKAQGRMVYTVPLIIFMDDVSGNISKQWNKHHAVYMSNANLPREMLEKEFFVRFVTSSPHAAPMELIVRSKAAQSGIVAWDCKDGEEVMLIPYGLFIAGDNPMQAEECSHAGLNCNYFCRTCDVGGTKEFKASDEGYNSIFTLGNLRTPEKTTKDIQHQFDAAMKPGATTKVQNAMSSTGVRDSASASILESLVELGKKLRKREPGVQAMSERDVTVALEKEFEDQLRGATLPDVINPLLGMNGISMHLDTPTEILHTVLLGVVKYFWGQTVFLLEKAKLLHLFQSRLESVDRDGLNAPSLNAQYICHYKGSLIGKHFKSLAQVMPFLVHDLVPRTVVNAWTVIGELVALVWHTSILDTEAYLAKLSRTIEDFLNVTAQCAPSILISKPKFHFLVHLPAYIRRFGPAIIFSTERYESFNHVFRLSCIHSNRRAPSRDTCRLFAYQDIVKHVATGGFWYHSNTKKWIRGGEQVIHYLSEHPEQAHLLGLSSILRDPLVPGEFAQRTDAVPWRDTHCAKILGAAQSGASYYHGKSLVTSTGEQVGVNRHVIFRGSTDGKMSIGCVREILISPGTRKTVEHVVLQLFTIGPTLHPLLFLPCLNLTDEEIVLTPADIICAVNIQHNCIDSKCADMRQQPIHQERIETARTKAVVQHQSTPHYFLNAYSIHNCDYIQMVIPETLRETPLRVINPAEARTLAVRQMKDKKAAKKAGEVPPSQEANAVVEGAQDTPAPAAAFDRAPA
ncbi:uncharacterized protein EDB91DRAFT_1043935, partial [Suillus paluster]|uniref:uncharacterized protein n=1 Tax=Suillus paluster TaxID=48578 RepID=UPI001B87FE2E